MEQVPRQFRQAKEECSLPQRHQAASRQVGDVLARPRSLAHLHVGLRQRRTTQPPLARAQVDVQQA